MNEQKSIYACYEEIKQREIRELKDAVKAHGGRYKFGANGPVIAVNYDVGPEDVTVGCVEIQNLSDTEIVVIYDTVGEQINKDDIAYGHIDFITKSIPKVDCRQYITLSREMRLFCETVVMLSADLYEKINERLPDFSAVCKEIVSLAQKFEKELDWDNKEETKDYLDELDKFEKAYLESVKED